jgi:hypothetical protein
MSESLEHLGVIQWDPTRFWLYVAAEGSTLSKCASGVPTILQRTAIRYCLDLSLFYH